MSIRFGALAFAAVLLLAGAPRAEELPQDPQLVVGLNETETVGPVAVADIEAGASESAVAVIEAAEQGSHGEVAPATAAEPAVAEEATSPQAVETDAALAPEQFLDPRQDETAALIAADLAALGDTTGSIDARVIEADNPSRGEESETSTQVDITPVAASNAAEIVELP